MHVKDLHPISLYPLLFSCHEDILWGTTVLCPPPSATQMPTSHQSTHLSLSKEPHLTQNRLLSEKQMSLLMKGMKIGAIMSYCVINEYKLHCQCYLQFHMAQSPVIMSMQLFRSEDFSVRDSRHGQNAFGSFCGARKLEPALEGFITTYLEANLWAKALKMGLDLKKRGGGFKVWRPHKWPWTVWSWGQNTELISKYSHGRISRSKILDLTYIYMFLPPLEVSSEIDFFTYGGGLVTKSCPTLATPWTVAQQAPLSMGFPRRGYWSGLPFPSPEDLPDPGIEPRSPALQAISLPTELPEKPFFTYNP